MLGVWVNTLSQQYGTNSRAYQRDLCISHVAHGTSG